MKVVDQLWAKDPLAVWNIERVLSGLALRLQAEVRRGKVVRPKVSLVERAQREALRVVK